MFLGRRWMGDVNVWELLFVRSKLYHENMMQYSSCVELG